MRFMRILFIKIVSSFTIVVGLVFLILSSLDGADKDFPLSKVVIPTTGKKVSFDFQTKYDSIYSVLLNVKPSHLNDAFELQCILGESSSNITCKNYEYRIEFSWILTQGHNLVSRGKSSDDPEGWLAGDGLSRRLCGFNSKKDVKYNITFYFESVVGDLSGLSTKVLISPTDSVIKEGVVNRSLQFLIGCLLVGFGTVIFIGLIVMTKFLSKKNKYLAT